MIEIKSLSYRYGDGRLALDGISLAIGPGETVGIIGANGAGKTTLFLCLAGVLRPGPGQITLANLDPAKAEDRPKLPGKLGIVFQQSDDQLFCANVGDDVAFGPLNLGLPRAEVKARASAALGQVGLTGQEERVPFHLSGGEKRRVAIAGILAMQPEVILFDEPSIYLDSKGRRELIELIGHLPGTKLIASHDLPFIARTCTRVIVLNAGKLVADAPTAILADQAFLNQHDLDSI